MSTESRFTCNAALLAEMFDCTQRNIGNFIARGMPVKEIGKGGRGHVFIASHAFNWHFGMEVCQHWGRPLPGTLETCLAGFFAIGKALRAGSFNERQHGARILAREMGYTSQQYDRAIDFLLAHHLIRW